MEIGHDFHANPLYCAESATESRFSRLAVKEDLRLRSGGDDSALLTQAGQGAEEIAAPNGAEAPTPDGRSSRGGAGQREAERPLPRGREEMRGRPA